MFPRLRTKATHLEDAEFAPRKQKCFASFPFANSYNIVSNIDSKCFYSNVSSLRLNEEQKDGRASIISFTSERVRSKKQTSCFQEQRWSQFDAKKNSNPF